MAELVMDRKERNIIENLACGVVGDCVDFPKWKKIIEKKFRKYLLW